MKSKTLLILIAAVLLINIVGFVVFRSVRGTKTSNVSVTNTVDAGISMAVQLARLDEAKGRRAAGMAALEAGDYAKALINLTEAKTLAGDEAKVDDLLKITDELRLRSEAKAAEEAKVPAPAVVAAPVAVALPSRPNNNVAVRKPVQQSPARPPSPGARPEIEPEKSVQEPAAAVVENGILLVSTTPRGLLVQIDGVSSDLTPMRASLKPGAHRVALFDGDKKIYETNVEITTGAPTTVIRDVTAELAPKTVEPVKPAVTPEKPVERTAPVVATPVEPKPVVVKPTPVAAPTISNQQTGGLVLTSPGLYGEVWVAGRPRGFPPVTVEGLPVGSVNVEVRVNGQVKRSSSVVVEAGQTKNFRIVR